MPQKSNDQDQRAVSPVPQDQHDELKMAEDDDFEDEDFDDETGANEDDDVDE